MIRLHNLRLLPFLYLFLSAVAPAAAQRNLGNGITIYPTVLYSGVNEITITSRNGIRLIAVGISGPITSVKGDGAVDGCPKEQRVRIFVNSASERVEATISIIDCRGRRAALSLTQETVWTLDQTSFGTVVEGERVCREFYIRESGGTVLDDVTVRDPHVSVSLRTTLPYRIDGGITYVYDVCFTADKPGVYTFPSITWMHRSQPSAGLTSYAVADTGVVRVLPKPPPPDTPIVQDTVPPIDQRRIPTIVPEIIRDPTTFRSVGVPNAVVPKRGTLYVGSYDLLGITAGYSLDNRLMIIVAGALPTPDDWAGIHNEIFGAWSIGLKLALQPDSLLHIAAGYQFGNSFFDREQTSLKESDISVHAPYIAVSYGTDDSRASLNIGYAIKRHRTLLDLGYIAEFNRNAWFAAAGGDYRIAQHWKIAAETAYIQTSGVLPVIATIRYFTNRFALEAGVAYVGIVLESGVPPAIPVLPVLTGVVVF